MALMQLGNFRPSTPESGLDVVLGQLPLDLHLLSCAIKTYLRLQCHKPSGWNGKGPGNKGKSGHILRMQTLVHEHNIPTVWLDQTAKTKVWEKLYTTEEDNWQGNNIYTGTRLYTDGSRLRDNSGYGAVLYDDDNRNLAETYGTLGPNATVFQAECHAIIEGLKLIPEETNEVTILTDNQSVVKTIDNIVTSSRTVHTLKQALNETSKTCKITVRWIKAHVGHEGNERADELAKLGSESLPIGPEPNIALSKAHTDNLVHILVMEMWKKRWSDKKRCKANIDLLS